MLHSLYFIQQSTLCRKHSLLALPWTMLVLHAYKSHPTEFFFSFLRKKTNFTSNYPWEYHFTVAHTVIINKISILKINFKSNTVKLYSSWIHIQRKNGGKYLNIVLYPYYYSNGAQYIIFTWTVGLTMWLSGPVRY